jgi:excisionase family DNA binding protein
MPDETPANALSFKNAAKRSGVGRSTLYEAVKAGKLRSRKCGKRSLILVNDLEAWLHSLPENKLPPTSPRMPTSQISKKLSSRHQQVDKRSVPSSISNQTLAQ